MSRTEEHKSLETRIKEMRIDYQRALFDHNYQLASIIKKNIKTLEAQKKHLEKNSEES